MNIEKITPKIKTTLKKVGKSACQQQKAPSELKVDVQKFMDMMGENNRSQISLLPFNINLSKKESVIRGKLKGAFQKISQAKNSKHIEKIDAFIAEETEKFYSTTKTADEIYRFEKGKGIVEIYSRGFLSKTKSGKKIISEIIENKKLETDTLERIFKNNQEDEIFSSIESQWQRAKDFHFEDRIYFNQKGVLNPDLNELEAKIEPRKIEIPQDLKTGKYNDNMDLGSIKLILEDSKNLTLEDGSLMDDYYGFSRIYDLPMKFASASYNTLFQKGNAYINIETPEIFKGIDEKEMFRALDLFSAASERNTRTFPKDSVVNIKIQGKDFKVKALEHGLEGASFKITDSQEKSAILKIFFTDSTFSKSGVTFAPAGLYGGLGILREANLADVVDVPKLYAANPIFTPIKGALGDCKGGWMLVEDAETKTLKKGLKIQDWLKSKGLIMRDCKPDGWVNNILVDLGFITCEHPKSYMHNGWGDCLVNEIYSRYMNNETTDEITKFINTFK